MKVALVFIALYVICVSAQAPKLCIAPSALSGKLFEIDTRRTFDVFANYTYDRAGERVRIDESIRTNRSSNRQYFDVIILFKERTMYRTDVDTKECRKMDLPDDAKFVPIGVPPDAHSYGEAVIGTTAGQGIGVVVDLWGGTSPRGGRYFGSWTNLDCIPVQELVTLDSGDIIRQNFYDMTIGYDPNRFIPPPNCQ